MVFKPSEKAFVDVLSLQERVIVLMRRERITRYAGGHLSGLWAYITPVFWIGLVVLAFHFLGRVVPIATHPALFVATGILPYAIFRQSITSVQRSVVANRFLTHIPGCRFVDILTATSLLELYSSIVVSLVTFVGIILAFDTVLPDDIASLSVALCVAWLLGVSFGLMFVSIGRISDTFSRAIPLILRPLFWISGIFYISSELPGAILDWLQFNPLLHVVEIFRESFFYGYDAVIGNLWYPLSISIGCLCISSVINGCVTRNKLGRHRS